MTRLLRIAYLVSQYPATTHTFVLREVRGLRELGLDVGVISIRRPDRPLEQMTGIEREEARRSFSLTASGVASLLVAHARTLAFYPIGYLRGAACAVRLAGFQPRSAFFYLAYFAQAVAAGNWMHHNGFSHVHSHFTSTVAMLISQIFPFTWSATMHGPDEFSDPIGFHLQEKIDSALFLIAISEYGRKQLHSASHVEICRLGVDPATFSPVPFRPDPRPFELLSVARLAPVKAQHVLIAAVAVLLRQGRAVRLRIAGEGPARTALEQEIARRGLNDKVILTGALNQDRLLPLYAEADLFVLSSLAEGVPVVLMEAMAREIACVATAVNGVPELIRNEIDGLLVSPADPDALAGAIAQLIDNAPLRQKLAVSGRQRVLDNYNIKNNIRYLSEIFDKYL